ncbi:MAG: hypothetical protein WDO15_16145 [Bacteroidota bacterium]
MHQLPISGLAGEYRLKAFRLRAGFNYMPDPYTSQQNGTNTTRMSASGGIGYRANKFFIDLTYINTWSNNSYRPYTLDSDASPLLKYSLNATNIVATVGFTF